MKRHLGVVTTKRGDFSQILLDKLGVGQYFDVVVGIESVSFPKPNAQPILLALQILNAKEKGISNDRIFMIGDTILDIQAATNAQIQPIGVLSGYGNKEQLSAYNAPLYPNALEAIESIAQKCTF